MKALLAVVLCLAATAALAQALPPIPYVAAGNATIAGSPAAPGNVIFAKVGNLTVGQFEVKDAGRYGFMYIGRDDPDTPVLEGVRDNESVDFYVNEALAQARVLRRAGYPEVVDLQVTAACQPSLQLAAIGSAMPGSNVSITGSISCQLDGLVAIRMAGPGNFSRQAAAAPAASSFAYLLQLPSGAVPGTYIVEAAYGPATNATLFSVADCQDLDHDGYLAGLGCLPLDCDDNRSAINPGRQEACNAIDDDCDGRIDNAGFEPLRQQCGVSDIGACRYGTQQCSLGAWSACLNAIYPSDERCNAIDDNCNGKVDEGNCLPVAAVTGIVQPAASEPATVACRANWACSAWSECLDGFQQRSCSDQAGCNATLASPALRQPCLPPATANDSSPADPLTGIVKPQPLPETADRSPVLLFFAAFVLAVFLIAGLSYMVALR